MLKENLRGRISDCFNQIMGWLEPKDVYVQALKPWSQRSFRMLLSDAFYHMFKWLDY